MPYVLGRDLKTRKREERNKKTSKSDPVFHYLSFLTHAPTTITPVACISAWVFVEIVRVVELALVTLHRWEIPLPPLVVAWCVHQSYTSIESGVVASH